MSTNTSSPSKQRQKPLQPNDGDQQFDDDRDLHIGGIDLNGDEKEMNDLATALQESTMMTAAEQQRRIDAVKNDEDEFVGPTQALSRLHISSGDLLLAPVPSIFGPFFQRVAFSRFFVV